MGPNVSGETWRQEALVILGERGTFLYVHLSF